MSSQNGDGANGRDGDDDGEDPRLSPVVGEVPAEIFELAEGFRQYVLVALGVELDYSPETLPVADEYLRVVGCGTADKPAVEELVSRAAAAYFGEIVRHRIDAFWRLESPETGAFVLCGRRAFVALSPLGMVLDSLARGEPHPGPSPELELAPDDRVRAEARLSRFPDVSDEDYYRLATRLEVIEVVYEAIRDGMKEEGRESIVYEPEDYADE